jgi:hypothetical protein
MGVQIELEGARWREVGEHERRQPAVVVRRHPLRLWQVRENQLDDQDLQERGRFVHRARAAV